MLYHSNGIHEEDI